VSGAGGRTGPAEFRVAYATALVEYLAGGDEAPRRRAYELGREAVAAGLGLMDVADAHHDAILAALAEGVAPEMATLAAGDLFLETLSAFEMLRRGAGEAREEVERERRHAAILRRLSDFLADASLSASSEDATHEILHLLAEQARELTGGACSVATVSAEAAGRPARAASYSQDDPGVGARLALADLSALEKLVAPPATVARGDPAPFLTAFDGSAPVRSWIAAPMARLDESWVGCLHVFGARPRAFGREDEPVLLQVAQMGSAAVERVQLYAAGAAHGSSPRAAH